MMVSVQVLFLKDNNKSEFCTDSSGLINDEDTSRIVPPGQVSRSGRIFSVSGSDFFKRKPLILILAGIIIVISLFGFAFRQILSSISSTVTGVAADPPLYFGYCGAELKELCILSFGRDADGNAVINFFVPDRDFPDFYLRINRLNGDSVYVCLKTEELPTSILCRGDVINLNERIEISLLSTEDYSLLARGKLTLTAILISSQAADAGAGQTPLSPTPSPPGGLPSMEASETEISTSTPFDFTDP